MTARVVQITDGIDTIDFEDPDSGYTLLAFRPAVSQREDDPEIWGRVDEQMEISVEGDTPTEVAQRLQLLAEMVERARQVANREPVDPVIYKYRIDDSLLTDPLEALIIGPPESGEALTLPGQFDNYTPLKVGSVDDPIVWRFRRRGALLGDEISASGAGVSNPAVMTATLAESADILSPTHISLNDLSGTSLSGGINGYLVLANASNKIQIYEAESGSVTVPGSGTFATAVDSAASGGSIRRLVPLSAGDYLLTSTIASLNADARRFLILVSARNNSGSVYYKVTGSLISKDTTYTRPKIIEPKAATPQIVALGPVTVRDTPVQMELTFTPSTTGSASDQLDVDHVDIIAIDESTHIITLESVNQTFMFNSTLEIDHALLEGMDAEVYEERTSTGDRHYLTYKGDVPIHMTGDVVAGAIIANTYSHWRAVNGTTTVIAAALTAARRPAYLVPR